MRIHLLTLTGMAALIGLVGCSQETLDTSSADQAPTVTAGRSRPQHSQITLSEFDVVRKLRSAGIELTRQEKTVIYPSDLKHFPAEPQKAFTVRLRYNKEGTPATFIQFASAEQAGSIRGVNGFHVHNWFFRGTISTYWVKLITEALR